MLKHRPYLCVSSLKLERQTFIWYWARYLETKRLYSVKWSMYSKHNCNHITCRKIISLPRTTISSFKMESVCAKSWADDIRLLCVVHILCGFSVRQLFQFTARMLDVVDLFLFCPSKCKLKASVKLPMAPVPGTRDLAAQSCTYTHWVRSSLGDTFAFFTFIHRSVVWQMFMTS